MRVSEADIRRTAQNLIHKHGDRAAVVAGMNAARLRLRGNMSGMDLWMRVLRAIGDANAETGPPRLRGRAS